MKVFNIKNQSGSALVTMLVLIPAVLIIASGLLALSNTNLARSKGRILLLQAQYAAESGADQSIAKLNANNSNAASSATSETTLITNGALYRATYTSTVSDGADPTKEKTITAVGKVYEPASSTSPKYTRTIRVEIERTGSMVAASMLSKNIVTIASSVKDVIGKDVYINNYLETKKNSTTLSFEKLTVGDRFTSSSNCSVFGPAKFSVPTSLSSPSKPLFRTAYNITGSGCVNSSDFVNSVNDFDIQQNQTDITKINSIYIPWSYKMNSSYVNGSCGDWSGSGTKNIPSVSKATHYPDSSGGISTSCGSSGNLALSNNTTYNINDHVHIRADLCKNSACRPIFNNPNTGAENTKFIFVEGTINFEQLRTSPSSGSIVFVVYGADPPTKTSVCPTGGAAYVGQQGSNNTNAPQIYILASNGVCLDGTKFGAEPGLGGIAGKNLYVASQQGQPFNLSFDINFPVNQIPIDLSWRAVRYSRIPN